MASPTERGCRPRPPVKTNGFLEREGCFETGVERNTNQRVLKVPRWVARILWAIKVQITLYVKIRRKGSFCFHRGMERLRECLDVVRGEAESSRSKEGPVVGVSLGSAAYAYSSFFPRKSSHIFRVIFIPRSSLCRIESRVSSRPKKTPRNAENKKNDESRFGGA